MARSRSRRARPGTSGIGVTPDLPVRWSAGPPVTLTGRRASRELAAFVERDLLEFPQTDHSALIPASLMIGHHFSISAF
jgi:hypothetical protein